MRLPRETGAAMIRVVKSTILPTVPNPADNAFAVKSRMPPDEPDEDSFFFGGGDVLSRCGAWDGACAAVSAAAGFAGPRLPEPALGVGFASFVCRSERYTQPACGAFCNSSGT